MKRRYLARVLLCVGLGGAALAGFLVWYFYYVADPRLKEVAAVPQLAEPIVLQPGVEFDVVATMDWLADTYLSRPENAGIVIGVVIDSTRYVVARGVASKRSRRPVDSDGLFEIGSITKGLTGLALAQAVSRGDVSLDQSIMDFAPASASAAGVPPISIEDLATHFAGLPSTPPVIKPWRFLFPPNPFRRLSEEELWRSLELAGSEIPTTRSYRYSNFGFMLLARILEHATGRPYAELVEKGIAEQLGMHSTYVTMSDSVRRRLVDGHSLGHRMEHNVDYELPGAEGVVSSMSDQLTLVMALMRPQGTALDSSIQLATEGRREAREGVKIGLGWHVRQGLAEERVIYHNGETLGFYSSLAAAPESGIGVVVLANSRDPSPGHIGYNLVEALLQVQGVRDPSRPERPVPQRP